MIGGSFEHVLWALKGNVSAARWRRRGWKPGAYIYLAQQVGLENFIAICTHDGRRSPWTPSRCDLFEDDWERYR